MKKCIAFIAMIAIFFGIAVTNVSAEEYEVVKGDNLWNIAQEYDTTVEYLVEINKLRTTVIQPKQKLIVNDIYVVEKDDTLKSISEEFDITVEDLKELNEWKYDWVRIGQELKVYDLSIDPNDEVTSKSKVKEPASSVQNKPEGKTIAVTATAYTAECTGCSGITYTGVNLNNDRNAKVIAVDPKVIPLGTKVYVEDYGYATAEDIGSAIKGNRIDLHVPTKKEAYSWGRRTVNVTIIN